MEARVCRWSASIAAQTCGAGPAIGARSAHLPCTSWHSRNAREDGGAQTGEQEEGRGAQLQASCPPGEEPSADGYTCVPCKARAFKPEDSADDCRAFPAAETLTCETARAPRPLFRDRDTGQ